VTILKRTRKNLWILESSIHEWSSRSSFSRVSRVASEKRKSSQGKEHDRCVVSIGICS
jgi:hypothetical protein